MKQVGLVRSICCVSLFTLFLLATVGCQSSVNSEIRKNQSGSSLQVLASEDDGLTDEQVLILLRSYGINESSVRERCGEPVYKYKLLYGAQIWFYRKQSNGDTLLAYFRGKTLLMVSLGGPEISQDMIDNLPNTLTEITYLPKNKMEALFESKGMTFTELVSVYGIPHHVPVYYCQEPGQFSVRYQQDVTYASAAVFIVDGIVDAVYWVQPL